MRLNLTHNQLRERYMQIEGSAYTRLMWSRYNKAHGCMGEVETFLFDQDPHNRSSTDYARVIGLPPWVHVVALAYVKELGLLEPENPNDLLKALL